MRKGLDLEASIIQSRINELGTQRTNPLDDRGKLTIALMVAQKIAARPSIPPDVGAAIGDIIVGVQEL